ncbi:siderophore esterase [Purpureocillium lavendulum]|uniref:Siderophore esterase n=1 Tax=Purpureocillium lavendulum TaxID=1247861 RepID=A0AB34FDE9_9HYPO|nr:siderophore esterase [Purpureocillium lavendulum]
MPEFRPSGYIRPAAQGVPSREARAQLQLKRLEKINVRQQEELGRERVPTSVAAARYATEAWLARDADDWLLIDEGASERVKWDLPSQNGSLYKIQVSWPLQWTSREGHHDVPVFYAVDGNAMFLTASEACWRRGSAPHFSGGGLVVAIGYPLDNHFLFSARRNYDLTPPSATSAEGYGGADGLLDFIDGTLKPFIASTVLRNSTVGRQALYGHSFGGLFALYTLFTRPDLLDCVVASSPSVYWDDFVILSHEKHFRREAGTAPDGKRPRLMMFYGSYEQAPPQWPGEDDEDYKRRKQGAEERAMVDNANAMHERLKACERLCSVTLKGYPDEDHGTVIACSLSRAVTTFFEEWHGPKPLA